ncbi:FeoA family protein [Actinomyces johnsonii]|uniref:FeoA family protein n=1 Tax=Actinomyces johnsonii TaxID=544581 RepID=UPI0028D404D2|nr:FeoA family protein [Actinomyces johnsonii]
MTTAVSQHSTSASTGTTGTPPPAESSLSDLRLGATGRVVGLVEDTASAPIIRRLSNLGFVPGRVVTPLRRAPLGDPVVYRVADYELCLRRHEARIVRVETIAETDDASAAAESASAVEAEVEEETSSTEPVAQLLGEEQHL